MGRQALIGKLTASGRSGGGSKQDGGTVIFLITESVLVASTAALSAAKSFARVITCGSIVAKRHAWRSQRQESTGRNLAMTVAMIGRKV
eukprot:616881-Pleurochrysis_carterae.AAC.1